MSLCPECEAVIEEDFSEVGDLFTCPECGVELEVVSLEPLEFDLAPLDEEEEEDYSLDESGEEEDWDDEDAYDDEEEDDEEEDEY